MRFDRGSIMAPIGSPTKMTGRDQMSIGGLGGNSDSRVSGGFMPQPAFDPSALERQIGGLQEQIGNLPSFDASQFATKDDLENRPIYDDTDLRKQITSIGQRPEFDDRALRERIGSIENKYSTGFDELNRNIGNIPSFDDSILRDRLKALEGREIPAFDPSQLQQGISGLEDRFNNLSEFDPSALQNRLNTLEGREIPQFDPSKLQSGIAGLQEQIGNFSQFDPSQLQNRLKTLESRDLPKFNPQDFRDDFLSIAREGVQMPEYKAPDLSGFARKEDIPSFDREALIKDIRSGINIPKPPSFDRDALIEDIRGGINIPSFDREKLIEDIRGGINIPQAPAFDRNKLIEDIRGGINIPQAPDLSAFDTRFADMQKRIDELSQRQPTQNSIPKVEPIMAQPLVPGSGNVPPMQNNGLIRDPNGNMVDPNNLPDNMVLEQDPNFGPSVRFADDYVLQPSDQGYMSNDPGRFNRGFEPIIRPPQVPPKRGDFMSINQIPNQRPTDDMARLPGPPLQATPAPGIGGMGGRPGEPEPINLGQPPVPLSTTGELPVQPGITAGTPPVQTEPVNTPVEPVNVTTPTDPNMSVNMPVEPLDPVLLQQSASEVQTDPLLRSLYFGTQDSPGFYNQLQQAGANLIGSDVPLQQTAGLSPLELLVRQKAVAGLGGFEPFLQQNRDLVNQGIAQSKRAEELQDPYYTQAEDIYKDTMGAYDPSMTQQFYNPYEDRVVQQTIDDVMKAGDKQDIASRAREISSGAFGGSRARLGAEERRESLGKGLAQALGNIRSQGFQSAQSTGLSEFARQQQAKRTGAQGLMGIGVGRGSAASQLGQQLAGYGSQIGGLGSTQEGLRAGQRGELSGYGTTGRGIAETGLGRIYEQQLGQQMRPLGVLGQIGSMLPGYQASSSRIDSQYGLPTDPTAAGLGAAFSAYGAVAPRQGQG